MSARESFANTHKCWLALMCIASPLWAAELATVSTETEPAYLEMSAESPVVMVLHKGDIVSVKYSIAASDGAWCVVQAGAQQSGDAGRSGNVHCAALNREVTKEKTREATRQPSPASPAMQRKSLRLVPASSVSAAANPSKVAANSSKAATPVKLVQPPPQTGDLMIGFGGPFPAVAPHNRYTDYHLVPNQEHFFVHVPANYTGGEPYGLVVFIDSGDEFNTLPTGWAEIFEQRKLLFIAPQRAGNNQTVARRLGLGVLGALEIKSRYNVDLKRVYAAGFSGGARMSNFLGFYSPELFSGTIQSCGADFYQPVPRQNATSSVDTVGHPYGLALNRATPGEIQQAKQTVRFVLITGSNDFRRGNILDIYNGGYAAQGFQAKLFDVPGMAHAFPDQHTLAQAISFLDAR